jgi:8-oxo-dGTP diphosphatase
VTLAVVLQVRGTSLCVLLWQRRRPRSRARGRCRAAISSRATRSRTRSARSSRARWTSPSCPGSSSSRPSATPTASRRVAARDRLPRARAARMDPALPPDTAWHEVDRPPRRARLRPRPDRARRQGAAARPSCPTRTSASRSRPRRSRCRSCPAIYTAALGYPVDPTNLRRVLERRGVLEPTGERRSSGPGGGRPAAVYRFGSRELSVTDPFAVLRPPTAARAGG